MKNIIESVDTDKEQLRTALTMYQEIMRFIDYYNKASLDDQSEARQQNKIDLLESKKGYIIWLDTICETKTKGILILTHIGSEPDDKKNPGTGKLKDTKEPYIRYPCMEHPYDLMEASFSIRRDVMVHELVHILDGIRIKDPTFMKPSSRFIDFPNEADRDYPSYFNDSLERNAFYMEGKDKALKALYRTTLEQRKDIFDSAKSFIEFCIKFFDKMFIKHLSTRSSQSLVKRLSRLYLDIKDDPSLQETNKNIKNLLYFS